jgi:hypothetical protein
MRQQPGDCEGKTYRPGTTGRPEQAHLCALRRAYEAGGRMTSVHAPDRTELLGRAEAEYHAVPIQRILRDVQALNQHSIMHPDTNLKLYGRVLCGQQPNTLYL